MRSTHVTTMFAVFVLALSGCAKGPDTPRTGTLIPREIKYVPDPNPESSKMLLYAYMPPGYLAEKAEYFANNGVKGVMFRGVFSGWSDDVWKQPTTWLPDLPKGRVVGEKNPLLKLCREMNRACAAVGITHNSVNSAWGGEFPDWFDDATWKTFRENYRQAAIFARMAGFAGMTIDIEYIHERYELDHEAYMVPGYPRDKLRPQARKRGYQLMKAMLSVFPDMVLWQLPEGIYGYGPLAGEILAGILQAASEVDAPGGVHLSTEGMYYNTSPHDIFEHQYIIHNTVLNWLNTPKDAEVLDYWNRRCSINIGMFPLGFFREMYDKAGNLIGYSGREEVWGDSLAGGQVDKSGWKNPVEFRRKYAAVRTLNNPYTWIYCHGSVLWRMTPEEHKRYRGSRSDTLPLAPNFGEYMAVLRDKQVFDDPEFARLYDAFTNQNQRPKFEGFAPMWWHIGPFPHSNSGVFTDVVYAPQKQVDLDAAYPAFAEYKSSRDTLRWAPAAPDSIGYVDLKSLISRQDSVLSYSVAWIETDSARTVYFRFGTNDYGAIYLNGTNIYTYLDERGAHLDWQTMLVNLPSGRSEVLVKVGDRGGSGYGFYLRIVDRDGLPVPGVKWTGPHAG